MALAQQPPLLTEYTPSAPKAPANRDPMHGFLRKIQDYDLDGVGTFGSALEPKRLRDEADAEHDTALLDACQWAIDHHRPDLMAILARAVQADECKDRHIARIDALFAENTEADRQSVAEIERLLAPSCRQRAGKRQVTR